MFFCGRGLNFFCALECTKSIFFLKTDYVFTNCFMFGCDEDYHDSFTKDFLQANRMALNPCS